MRRDSQIYNIPFYHVFFSNAQKFQKLDGFSTKENISSIIPSAVPFCEEFSIFHFAVPNVTIFCCTLDELSSANKRSVSDPSVPGVFFLQFAKPGWVKDNLTSWQKNRRNRRQKMRNVGYMLVVEKIFSRISDIEKDTYICSIHFVKENGPHMRIQTLLRLILF